MLTLTVSPRTRLGSPSSLEFEQIGDFFADFHDFSGFSHVGFSNVIRYYGTGGTGIETTGIRRCFTRRIGQRQSVFRCEKSLKVSKKSEKSEI